jgi:hypothetical protein
MPYRTVGPSPYSVGHADSSTFKVCQLIAHMHGARAPGRDDIFGDTLDTYLTPRLQHSIVSCSYWPQMPVAACYSWYDALPLKSRYALHLHAVTIACQPHLESSFLQARLPRLLPLWVPDPANLLHFSYELNRLVCDPVHQTRPSHVPTWPSTTVLPRQNTCIRDHKALY